ncbi:trypsin-like peptidase domain-containing protein [Streptomyces sp. NPDC060205]|uniref:nSTAND1 domain-containing NTPase n=1 Tax=Streptomyces sp. NPDC060205 TaxID=3347072 RepID=UPI00365B915A
MRSADLPEPRPGDRPPAALDAATGRARGDRAPVPAGVLQVLAGDGTVVGAGFLTGEATAVTCAHVVRAAGAGPGDRVEVVFPHLPAAPRTHGRVPAEQWRSPSEQDVAFLRLAEVPVEARVLALGSANRCRGHRVYAFGFPGQAPQGGHFGYGRAGDLLPDGPGGQLLQLHEANDVTTGFSGGPVVDEVTHLVVGMVTSITAPDAHLKGLGMAYATPTEVLRQVQPGLAVQQIHPYRGLEPFTADDARFFFGRDDAIHTVLAELGRQRRLLLLLGPSGAGKSSLIQAGVLPALARGALPGSDRWLPLMVRPGEDLSGELQRAGLPDVHRGLLPAIQHRLDGDPAHDRLLLVIDQFEELLTQPDPTSSHQHAGPAHDLAVTARAPAPCSILLIMRDDFYPRLAATAPQILQAAAPALLNIPASVTLPDLRAIITRPAQEAGARLEDGLAERIITDILATTADHQAPVTLLAPLELALAQLWQRLDDNGRLTHHAYQHIGAVTGSLTTWCNTALSELPADHRPTAQRLLTALVRPADDTLAIPATRQHVPLTRLRALSADPAAPAPARDAAFDTVLATLTRHRVITTRTPPRSSNTRTDTHEEPVAELIHDALLRDWGDLRDWTAQDQRFQNWLHRTTEHAARHTRSRLPADLLTGSALQEGLDWARQRILPTDLTTFLAASHKQQRTAARRTRRVNIVLAGLLALALLAAGTAFWQRQSALDAQHAAVKAQRTAQSRQLAAQSNALFDTDPDLASLLAVAAYRTSPTREAVTSLYAAADSPLRYRLTGHKGGVSALAFSPVGRVLAGGGYDDDKVRLWDPATGRLRRTLSGQRDGTAAVAFSPDGRVLASSGQDGTVRLWNPATGSLRRTLSGHGASPLAFSPDGRTLAGGGYDDDKVRLWDPATGRLRRTLSGHRDGISAVAFSPDGRTLAGGGYDDKVRLWDPATGRLRRTLSGHQDGTTAVAFSPDGRTLAGGGYDDKVRLWDPATGRLRRTLSGHQDGTSAVAFSPDGRTLGSGGFDDRVRLWDPRSGQLLRDLVGHKGAVSALAFSPDGRTLASGGDGDGAVRVVGQMAGPILISHEGVISAVAFDRAGHTLACSLPDDLEGKAWWWNSASGHWRALAGQRVTLPGVVFSLDGQSLASGGYEDGKVRLWDPVTGRLRRTLTGDAEGVDALAFSGDGRSLAVGGYEGKVWLWDPVTGRLRRTLTSHEEGVAVLAFSGDGRSLAVGGYDGRVRLWDPVTGRLRRTLTSQQGGVFAVAFSPDGRTLAGGGYDGTIRLWDSRTGRLLRTLAGPQQRGVLAVAFSPDGRTLASGGYQDGPVRLWDFETGLWRTLTGHQGGVLALAFSPDGRILASGSRDGTVRQWKVGPPSRAAALDKICKSVGRDLSADEKAAYLAGQAVEPVCARDATHGPG